MRGEIFLLAAVMFSTISIGLTVGGILMNRFKSSNGLVKVFETAQSQHSRGIME